MGLSKFSSCVILAGGESDEREVSIESGKAVYQALSSTEIAVELLILEDNTLPLQKLNGTDVVFIALHGEFGEGGDLQCILSENNIPFTGSLEKGCRNSFDKIKAKKLMIEGGVNTPKWVSGKTADDLMMQTKGWGFPLVMKPIMAGSSQGVSLVHSIDDIYKFTEEAFRFSKIVMLEQYIDGRELSVSILDGETLPIIELKTNRSFYDYQAKYQDDKTEYICPASLDLNTENKVNELALQTFYALEVNRLARVDIMLDNLSNPYSLELNIIPGLTPHSLLPKSAKVAGINFPNLCLKMLEID